MNNSKFKKIFYRRLIKFSLESIKLSNKIKNEKNYWFLANQFVRSATSIGANIIEAKASISRKEYINFFHIALKSSNETMYWLTLIKESLPQYNDKTQKLSLEAQELNKIISSAILTMKVKNKS